MRVRARVPVLFSEFRESVFAQEESGLTSSRPPNPPIPQPLNLSGQGDVAALEAQLHAGVDLFALDYDQRSAMHLAGAQGQEGALRFLVRMAQEKGVWVWACHLHGDSR